MKTRINNKCCNGDLSNAMREDGAWPHHGLHGGSVDDEDGPLARSSSGLCKGRSGPVKAPTCYMMINHVLRIQYRSGEAALRVKQGAVCRQHGEPSQAAQEEEQRGEKCDHTHREPACHFYWND